MAIYSANNCYFTYLLNLTVTSATSVDESCTVLSYIPIYIAMHIRSKGNDFRRPRVVEIFFSLKFTKHSTNNVPYSELSRLIFALLKLSASVVPFEFDRNYKTN